MPTPCIFSGRAAVSRAVGSRCQELFDDTCQRFKLIQVKHMAAIVEHGALQLGDRCQARFEIAAAKARIGEAVALVAGVAHQVHAAMGFTHEHTLHRSTRRLWSWRDEFGTESEWQAWVGAVAAKLEFVRPAADKK